MNDRDAASPSPGAPIAARPPLDPAVLRRMRVTALIVASSLFMQNVDSTVIATALPTMARAFNVEPVRMNVAMTSYLLSLAVFIPASGWMADRFGARNVFRIAIAVFTLASVLCGSAALPGDTGGLPRAAGRRRGDDGAGRPAACCYATYLNPNSSRRWLG